MKTRIIALVLALPLMACVSTTPTNNNTQAIIIKVQNAAIQACGYYPVASAVADLLSVFIGGGAFVGEAEQVAQAICAAAAQVHPASTTVPKAMRKLAAKQVTVVVNGVPVTGHFVR